jgi:uncharacterized protein
MLVGINFFPSTLEEEIRQNIETIVTTIAGSVPLDRGFGLPVTAIDNSPLIARARLTGQVMTAIAKQEPRVEVTSVDYRLERERLIPVVSYRIKEGAP